MIKRCIMIFPKFENGYVIDNIRNKYDPLSNFVKPHITLVFPFDSNIKTQELEKHISQVLNKFKPFNMTLSGVGTNDSFKDEYLFLNVREGKEDIIKIHQKLYSGILESYYPDFLKKTSYLPHLTIGSFNNVHDFKVALEDTRNINDVFKTRVTQIDVEIIGEKGESTIEFGFKLT